MRFVKAKCPPHGQGLSATGTSGCIVLGGPTKNWSVDRTIPSNQLAPFRCGAPGTNVRQNLPLIQVIGPRFPTACALHRFSQPPLVSIMSTKSQRPKRRDVALSSLNAAIDAMNIAKDVLGMTPAKAAFGTVSVILTTIRVGFLLLVLVDY